MPEPNGDRREVAGSDGGRPRPAILLLRGCGPLGREVAIGIEAHGYRPVSIDKRTTAGPAESRRVDLGDVTVLRRELLSLARDHGPVQAVVLLPRENPEEMNGETNGERWERTADELLETTAIIRAAGPVLGDAGHLVLVAAGFHDEPSRVRRTTPAETIIELGAAAVAEEVGVPLVRCVLDGRGTSRREMAEPLLDAVHLPSRRATRGVAADAGTR